MSGIDDNDNDYGNDVDSTTKTTLRRSSRKSVPTSPAKTVTSKGTQSDDTTTSLKESSNKATKGKQARTGTTKRKSVAKIKTAQSAPVDQDNEDDNEFISAYKSPSKSKKLKTDKTTNKTSTKIIQKTENDDYDDEHEVEENDKQPNKQQPTKSTTGKVRDGTKNSTKKSKNVSDQNDDESLSTKIDSSDKPESAATTQEKTTKPKKAPSHQVLTQRDEIPKLWTDEMATNSESYTFKVASWNVAGLRAVLNKAPNTFLEFAQKHDLDVLCLQETKLQESHLDDPKLNLRATILLEESGGYDAYYSCSTAKKGYSGTAIFVKRRKGGNKINTASKNSSDKKKQTSLATFFNKSSNVETKSPATDSLNIDVNYLIPENVSYKMGIEKHDQEGRFIVLDYALFTLCNVYVPNSGQNLERLSYRTDEWDKDFLSFMQQKQKERNVPVLWLGDLNVAHTNLEVWNDGAKHLAKQAGVTAEERQSFQEQLDSGFVDAFRKLHPTAAGHYSYWSQRAGNRLPNKGLRLDYFICDPKFFDESSQVIVRDSYMDHQQEGSDHCPVLLEIQIKKQS